MALFNGFFNRLIDSIDDVEGEADNVTEQVRREVLEAVDAIDENAEVRQQVLHDMQRRTEDPHDAFLRRSRERRQAENMRGMVASFQRDLTVDDLNSIAERLPRLTDVVSFSNRDAIAVPRSIVQDAPTVRSSTLNQHRRERFMAEIGAVRGLSADFMYELEPIPTPSSVISGMAAGFQAVSNSLNSSMNTKTSDREAYLQLKRLTKEFSLSSQKYLELEKLTQEFALSVQALLEAESPSDFLIQKSVVEEHMNNILSTRKVEETSDEPTSEKATGLTIELD